MNFNIETSLISETDADRLYRDRPELCAGPDDYCPTCRKTGTYRWGGVDHICNCTRQLQLAKHYSAAGIGREYQSLDWTDFEADNTELRDALFKYIEHHERYISRGIGLLFYGPIGTGKTLLATLMLKELIKLGYSGFSTTFAETVDSFTSTWGANNQANRDWFADKFVRSQVLLLDDLGRELRTTNNLPQSTFDRILRRRVSECRPVILTTNSTLTELGKGYGAQVLSLLMEQSIAYEFVGNDFRPKANARKRAEAEHDQVRPIF